MDFDELENGTKVEMVGFNEAGTPDSSVMAEIQEIVVGTPDKPISKKVLFLPNGRKLAFFVRADLV